MDRLDLSLLKHSIDAGTKGGGPDFLDVDKLQEMSDVHDYLKAEHEFSPAEVVSLMRFADPLEVAVACWKERGPSEPFSICGLLDKIKAYERFPKRYLSVEDVIPVLKDVLDQNMSEYQASLLHLDKPELIERSAEIAATQDAYGYMKNYYRYTRSEVETLIRMENPLQFVAALWPSSTSDMLDMRMEVFEAIEKAAKDEAPQRSGQSSEQEKPSIREQLHEAAKDTAQRQSSEARAKGGEAR